LTTTVIPDYGGFLLAILPPGAFIGMGLLIALKNVIDARKKEAAPATIATPAADDADSTSGALPAKG
jgi:electron transport complex protein RnfE